MALFKKVVVKDDRGGSETFTASPFSRLQVHQTGRSICVSKEDIFGIKEETTCIHQPELGSGWRKR